MDHRYATTSDATGAPPAKRKSVRTRDAGSKRAPRTADDALTAAAATTEIPEIDHYELDGIPLFHLPAAGATTISLQFRVGTADESVPQRGMTHLAEHLLLSPIMGDFESINGTTESLRVSFHARGTPAEAARFLSAICRQVARADVMRIGEEAKVLRTEAAGRSGMGLSGHLMFDRTGYQGFGTTFLPELFLRTLDEQRLKDWIGERFVAGNAAIWISGPLPEDLFVELPPGPRRPPPAMTTIPGFEAPTITAFDDAPGLGASFIVRRSLAATATFRALQRRLQQALRVDRGLGYEVGGDYLPVGSEQAVAFVWASCLPAAARDVQRVLFDQFDVMAQAGVTEEELEAQRLRFDHASTDPATYPGRLDHHVLDVLLGDEPKTAAELFDEYWHLEPDHTARAMREAMQTMLFIQPTSIPKPQRALKPYPGPALGSVGDGRQFDYAQGSKGLFRSGPAKPRLAVGERGVCIDVPDRRVRLFAVMWDDCVGVVQDGPGLRTIIGRDGYLVHLAAQDWRDGGTAVRLIDRFAPTSLVVPSA